jgi:hypothetical protein
MPDQSVGARRVEIRKESAKVGARLPRAIWYSLLWSWDSDLVCDESAFGRDLGID